MIDSNIDQTEHGCICLLCGVIIKRRNNVPRHFESVHYDSGVQYFCPLCKKVYSNKHRFSSHIYGTHKDWKGINYKKYVYDAAAQRVSGEALSS